MFTAVPLMMLKEKDDLDIMLILIALASKPTNYKPAETEQK
ncbi:MAG TPA: hypothetical protein PKN84_01275 [Paludibacteraceae bacterium]|jgi:hypothetical protein|nr:hypothetical protein [Paludibacteraceae bacterium]